MNINNNKISNYSDYFSIFDKKQNYDDSSLVQNIYKEKFSNLITKYLHSDTKCASFLSSGVDSSYISKLISQKKLIIKRKHLLMVSKVIIVRIYQQKNLLNFII